MALDDVHVELQQEATSPVRDHADLISRLQAGVSQRLHRDGRLVLGADASEASLPIPYFFYNK